MNVEIAELALLVMLRKDVEAINCEHTARATETEASHWREAKRRMLNKLQDQIAFKTKQIEQGER